MRVGLLSRFWGSLGMALGAAALLLELVQFTMIFFLYFALLVAGWVPGGRPPAWATGEAVPWPTPGEKGAAELGGSRRGAGGAGNPPVGMRAIRLARARGARAAGTPQAQAPRLSGCKPDSVLLSSFDGAGEKGDSGDGSLSRCSRSPHPRRRTSICGVATSRAARRWTQTTPFKSEGIDHPDWEESDNIYASPICSTAISSAREGKRGSASRGGSWALFGSYTGLEEHTEDPHADDDAAGGGRRRRASASYILVGAFERESALDSRIRRAEGQVLSRKRTRGPRRRLPAAQEVPIAAGGLIAAGPAHGHPEVRLGLKDGA